MAFLDHERATLAFKHVQVVKAWEKTRQKKYASVVYALPALVRSAGLSQALHFVQSRRKNEDDDGPKRFLEHLAEQLKRIDDKINTSDELLAQVRGVEDLTAYLRLTQEVLACVDWYRRFVQGELDIEAGDADVRECRPA
jgi:CRISPR type III-B/RAMP module-associated protein Cmr5